MMGSITAQVSLHTSRDCKPWPLVMRNPLPLVGNTCWTCYLAIWVGWSTKKHWWRVTPTPKKPLKNWNQRGCIQILPEWLKNILTCLTPDSPCWSAYVTKTRDQLTFLLFLHYSLKFPSLKFNVDQSHQKTCLFTLYDLTCLPNSYITCHIASFYSCQWTSERKSKIIIDKFLDSWLRSTYLRVYALWPM